MAPGRRARWRSLVHRILRYQSIRPACDPAIRVGGRRKFRAITRNSWWSIIIVGPAASSFSLLWAGAELTTVFPIAGGIYVLTAMITSWFIPYAAIKETCLADVQEGAWFVKRRGGTAIVVQVSVISRDDGRITLSLLDGEEYPGDTTEKVGIAELRDPYRFLRYRPVARFDSLDREAEKYIIAAVHALRPHGARCTCPTAREEIVKWAGREGLDNLDVLLDSAFRWGLLEEQDGEIHVTGAGRKLLEVPATRVRVLEPPVESRHNVLIMNPVESIIVTGPSTYSQLATGSNSAQDLKVRSSDEKKVLDLLHALADKQNLLSELLSAGDVGRIGGSTADLTEAIRDHNLRTPKVKRALRTLWEICQNPIISGVIGGAIWDGLKHLL
jgi:hypothetical protein